MTTVDVMSPVPTDTAALSARLRPCPPPYRAMLAVCSDLDETPDRQTYGEIARFLNTMDQTAMGPGVGLEIGNTIYFDMPADQFSYWNTDDAGRAMVHAMIRSGHIDCLHSYGDHATTRADAENAQAALAKHDCRLEVWVDHAQAASNFGADIMVGSGDVPGHAVYHADLTCAAGVTYVWRGRVTSVIGQDVPRSLTGVFNGSHPLASSRAVAKEIAKGVLARRGDAKYAMHAPNEVLRPARLRDGRPVIEFLRANPFWGGVENAATADGIAEVLTEPMLRRLTERGGVSIVYTHLGKVRDPRVPFGPETVAAFRRLADFQRRGEILVTTTRRLLGYRRAVREARVEFSTHGDQLHVRIDVPEAKPDAPPPITPRDLEGLTVEIPADRPTRMFVGEREIRPILTPAAGPGRWWATVPWTRLEFPAL